jgi:hypothetical protein
METWRDELAIVQAQVAVQHLVLQSLLHSHPQPDVLLQQWRRLRADCVAQTFPLPADARSSDWLSQHMQVFAEDWTAELVDVIARGAGQLGEEAKCADNFGSRLPRPQVDPGLRGND